METIAQPAGPEPWQLESNDFRRIVVATDFSPLAEKAFRYAMALARQFSAEIVVVHAVARHPRRALPMDALRQRIDAAYREAGRQMDRLDRHPGLAGIRHHTLLLRGAASDAISSMIGGDEADLLVLGTRGRTGFQKLALGSVAEEGLRVARCPVLTVGPLAPRAPEAAGFRRVLFATDFGAVAERAFQYAAGTAYRSNANLILLHTVPPISEFKAGPATLKPPETAAEAVTQWERRVRDESLHKLRGLVSSFSKQIETEYAVIMDFSLRAILQFMMVHKPDLLVIGANRVRSCRFAAHAPGSVVHGVLCAAHCPVLTITG